MWFLWEGEFHAYVSIHLHSRWVVHIIVHSNFDLVSLLLTLKATELSSEPVAVELIDIHLMSVQ